MIKILRGDFIMAEFQKIVSYYKKQAYNILSVLWEKRRMLTKIKDMLTIYNRHNRNSRKYTYSLIGLGSISAILIIGFVIQFSLTAYQVDINGRTLALVKNKDVFYNAVEEVKKEMSEIYEHEIVIEENVSFKKIKAGGKDITSENTIINNIKAHLDVKVKATAIAVNDQNIVEVSDLKTAQMILNEIKTPYLMEETEYNDIRFREKVELKEVTVNIDNIYDKEEALYFITRGTDEERTHEVVSGDNTWVIAHQYNLSVEEVIKANPTIDPERLKIGQVISLVVPKPYITVQTKEYVELVESIPFETEYVKTDSLYKGDKKITVQGEEGQAEIKGYIVKENGIQVAREIVEETIVSEPKTRIIAEGTKTRPATVATGSFLNPTRGRLTSRFGLRWGRRHEGIDIGASIGTSVTSADAGRVSFSGKNGAYGNLVIIDHENGYQTYYAHCSKLLVKKGDRVYKGQQIATVGNTGRSTGPHLHFEVRKNGTPVNPLQFVKY
jgi:murein DD-endopeptidase MepM/ murein hydrolase activator NlpD